MYDVHLRLIGKRVVDLLSELIELLLLGVTTEYERILMGNRTMQILVVIGTVGASPQTSEILPLCDFLCPILFCPVLFFSVTRLPRLNHRSNYHALWLKQRVSA